MKQPTLFEGMAVALAVSIVGSITFVSLAAVFMSGNVIRLIIAGLCFAYVMYLLSRSSERIGRVIVVSSWLIAAVSAWFFAPSLFIYILIHITMLWLIRSLYFYSSVLSSLADLCLTGLALVAAIWAWLVTSSLFLSFWCFFLVQALFVLIPRGFARIANNRSTLMATEDRFERAHQAAESALRKFTSIP